MDKAIRNGILTLDQIKEYVQKLCPEIFLEEVQIPENNLKRKSDNACGTKVKSCSSEFTPNATDVTGQTSCSSSVNSHRKVRA